MTNIMLIAPVFKERVWGGTRLRHWFGEDMPSGVIGECWAVSGLSGDSGTVQSGAARGMTLEDAWHAGFVTGRTEPDSFPLLAKFLDTSDWLSVQVHPNDLEAVALGDGERGKAECWYVIEADADAQLIIGHDSPTAADLQQALADGDLDRHLTRASVKAGDFVMVGAGDVHAVGPDMLIFEMQQSSDITYRLYDFDRPGLDGKPRELHVDKGFSVVTAPHDPSANDTAGEPESLDGATIRPLAQNEFFHVTELQVTTKVDLRQTRVLTTSAPFAVVGVVTGSGTVRTPDGEHDVKAGTCFLVPADCAVVEVMGELTLILTTPGKLSYESD